GGSGGSGPEWNLLSGNALSCVDPTIVGPCGVGGSDASTLPGHELATSPYETVGSSATAGSDASSVGTLGNEASGSSGLTSLLDPFSSTGSDVSSSGLGLANDPFSTLLSDFGFGGTGLGSEMSSGLGTFGADLSSIWSDLAGLF
ncbi:MAG: hypothetical protein WA317_05625, partial [Mycobacterium sp.]|uniref:hypothetical protein n=1 Tax=Mycobacterium sp. TaxID=1785 RepID=UPI003CC58C45